MTMKPISLFLIAAAAVVAGCSKSEAPPPSTATATRELRFAVIPKALDIPVFNYARIGAERAAAELGNVRVEWRAPDSADQLRQKEILESFITQRVDGIAISALNGDFLTETINRAIDAGIPVVTWDSDAPKSKRIAFYGVDDMESGRIMGREAIKLLGGKGKVAIITSVGATNLQQRLDGVREALATAPGIRSRKSTTSRKTWSGALRLSPAARGAIRIFPPGLRSAAGRCSRATPSPPWIRRKPRSSRSTRSKVAWLCSARERSRCCSARSIWVGQRNRETAARDQELPHAAVADHQFRRRHRDPRKRRGLRGTVEEAGGWQIA